MREKLKKLLTDSVWSIAGLLLMNVVAQFLVYPIWNSHLGEDRYGTVLYLLSVMNIVAVSMGISCNYTRMRSSTDGETRNTPYLVVMLAASALSVPLVQLLRLIGLIELPTGESLLYTLLMALTMWRYYADVQYRLHLNYRGYFLYYLTISAGYGVGILLFASTGLWPLALLPGEAAGLLLVLLRGRVLRFDGRQSWAEMSPTVKLILILLGSEMLSALIFNGDRVLLNLTVSGAAVTAYYLASLLGKTVSLISTPLNSVVIGHLARYQGRLTLRLMHLVLLAALAATALGTAACTVASHMLIRLLYPDNYEAVRGMFIIANLAQVCYFITNMLTVMLLRFAKPRCQAIVNGAYTAAFCVICIPMTLWRGLDGLCLGLLLTSMTRMLTALLLGYQAASAKDAKE